MRTGGAGPEASKPRATGILQDISYMGSIPTPSAKYRKPHEHWKLAEEAVYGIPTKPMGTVISPLFEFLHKPDIVVC